MAKPRAKYDPSFADTAHRACAILGADDVHLAKFLGVSRATLSSWKNQHPEFKVALVGGKEQFDTQTVEQALLKRALGYEVPYEKLTKEEGKPDRTETGAKHIPGDTTAMIFWLCNRQPDRWRQRNEVNHTGNVPFQFIVNAPPVQPQEDSHGG